jgi:hypothetical protein
MTNKQENILNGVEIIRNGDQIIAKVPLKLTEAKLDVLCQVAKAWKMDLSDVIEESIDQDIRCQLESSNDVGEALNKRMCDTWLKEIGEGPDDNQGA